MICSEDFLWSAIEGLQHGHRRTKSRRQNENGRGELSDKEEKRRMLKGVTESAYVFLSLHYC